MTERDYAETGSRILAAYDAGEDWPEEPLIAQEIGNGMKAYVFRHSEREGMARVHVRSGKMFTELHMSWDALRRDPAAIVSLLVSQSQFSFRQLEVSKA